MYKSLQATYYAIFKRRKKKKEKKKTPEIKIDKSYLTLHNLFNEDLFQRYFFISHIKLKNIAFKFKLMLKHNILNLSLYLLLCLNNDITVFILKYEYHNHECFINK